jgi:YfiH family protein
MCGIRVYISPLLEAVGVPHGFSTRDGGVSAGPYASLNLGTVGGAAVQDEVGNIRENYRRLLEAIGAAERERCWIHQVHGSEVAVARIGEEFECGVKADAMVCDDPRRVVSVKYADCVPILMAAEDGRAVAAVHAGWRGVVAGVAPAAVDRLADIAGRRAADLVVAIGPCIGVEHFEVGAEVAELMAGVISDCKSGISEAGKPLVDLREAVRRQLIEAGVKEERIDGTDRCTYRDAEEFFSHRRDGGVTGRMAAVIGARASDPFPRYSGGGLGRGLRS